MPLLSSVAFRGSLLNFEQLPIFIGCFFLAIIVGPAALNYNRKSKLPHANPPSVFDLPFAKQRESLKNGQNTIFQP